MTNPFLNKIPHMDAKIRSVGTNMDPIQHPEDVLNARMQPKTSLPASKTSQYMDFQNDIRYEKTPYSPPTQVSKGLTTSNAGGSFTLYDKTGGTKIFDYNPATGVITIIGSLVANQVNTGTYTAITLAGNNPVVGTMQNGVYGTALYQGGTIANATLGTPLVTGTLQLPTNSGSPTLSTNGMFSIETFGTGGALAYRVGGTTFYITATGTLT